MVTTAKEPKSKKSTTPSKKSPFERLLASFADHADYLPILKTAGSGEWFTNGRFFTRMTEQEGVAAAALYKKNTKAKAAKKIDVEAVLPATVGNRALAVSAAKQGRITVSDRNGRGVVVDESAFEFLKKRHPRADLYLSPNGDAVVFSGRTTEAVLLPLDV